MKKAALRTGDWQFRRAGLETISVTATQARREFGRILDMAAQGQLVVITRYDTPHAVMTSIDDFDVDTGADSTVLDTLTAEFDALLDQMQTPEARRAMDQAFNASPGELGRAAVDAARCHAL